MHNLKGNTVSRNARGSDDPAVKITRKGVSTQVYAIVKLYIASDAGVE